jgi:predicted nucleic acid-binding protein
VLTDAGPLIALFDEDDKHHASCSAILCRLPYGPLVTTWPYMTEAMYLLHGLGRYRYQNRLWRTYRDGRLVILDITAVEVQRMDALMLQYQNVPMDFADASLIAVAESRGFRRLFTIDSDFYIYRRLDGSTLEILSQ